MQKDFHYYVTDVLCQAVGIKPPTANIIAWANQFTDDNTKAELHGMQTQSSPGVFDNWSDPEIQTVVLAAFHFIPGDDPKNAYVVTPYSCRARILVESALNCPFRTGISLHTLQDTFSHQGWTGWEEKFNACFDYNNPWAVVTPDVGHADVRTMPDVANIQWTDPRTGRLIDNRTRALEAAKATYVSLTRFNGNKAKTEWSVIEPKLREIFDHNTGIASADYDWRKKQLRKLGTGERYSEINKRMNVHKLLFIKAARKQLGVAMGLMDDPPRPEGG